MRHPILILLLSGSVANAADVKPTKKKSRKGRPGVARALCPNPDVTRDIRAERCPCGTACYLRPLHD